MSDIAPSIVEQILRAMFVALEDGPAKPYEEHDEVRSPEQLPAIVLTVTGDVPAEEPENAAIRNLTVVAEILAKREQEGIPVRTEIDRVYVWAVNALITNRGVEDLSICISEGACTWDFPEDAPGFGYKSIEFLIRYARSVEDASQ